MGIIQAAVSELVHIFYLIPAFWSNYSIGWLFLQINALAMGRISNIRWWASLPNLLCSYAHITFQQG